MSEEKSRICPRCLIRDLSEADQKDLLSYLARIRKEDQAEEKEYERRLAVCRECSLLLNATCLACGCYAEFRAYGKRSHCPKKKW